MYNFFIKNEKLTRNPFSVNESVKFTDRSVIFLTNEEQNRLLDVIISNEGLSDKAKINNQLKISSESNKIVKGPSLSKETFISAPNKPDST